MYMDLETRLVRHFIIIHILSKELVTKAFTPVLQFSDTRNL
jgi:hypothetical protein